MGRGASKLAFKGLVRPEVGFTLVELMISFAISTIVVMAGFTVLTTSNKANLANNKVAGAQYNARVAIEILSRDIKMAGFGMTGPVGACTTPLVPVDNVPTASVVPNDVGPDQVSLVVPATSNATTSWTLAGAATGPFTQISLTSGNINDMVTAGLINGSVISLGGATSAQVSNVNAAGGLITLGSTIGAPMVFPVGTPVYLLQCVTYRVETTPANFMATCGSNGPCLVRNNQAVAEGIEDLQLAYACDGCVSTQNGGVPDGIIDDQDGVATTWTEADWVTNNTWGAPPMTADKIRQVQITLVAVQIGAEQGLGEGSQAGVNTPTAVLASDHLPSNDVGFNLATYQQSRRRVLIRTVETRNVGL